MIFLTIKFIILLTVIVFWHFNIINKKLKIIFNITLMLILLTICYFESAAHLMSETNIDFVLNQANKEYPDLWIYYKVYRSFDPIKNAKGMEIGLFYMMNLLKFFSIEFYGFLCIIFILISSFMVFSYYKMMGNNCLFPFVCICLIGFFTSLHSNILRQGLAQGLIMVALAMLLESRLWLCLLFLALSCIFHNTAIIFSVFVLIFYRKRSIQISLGILLVTSISIVLFLNGSIDFSFIIANKEYNSYLESEVARGINYIIGFILLIPVIISGWAKDKVDVRIFNIYLFWVLLYLLASFFIGHAYRLAYYPMFLTPMLVGKQLFARRR